MSNKSNNYGRAYEYAWIIGLESAISASRSIEIVNNSSLDANKKAWDEIPEEIHYELVKSVDAALDTVLELEPKLTEPSNKPIKLQFQSDDAGKKGDVRDVVARRQEINWEVGLSIKHNHKAVKHSRLSSTIDFGSLWYGVPCSNEYWDAVSPTFDMLKNEKAKKTKWKEFLTKEDDVYLPILSAFMAEVNRAYSADSTMPKKMVEYLIGVKDYYKIVSYKRRNLTLIHSFNLHNTLNKPSSIRASAISVPLVMLPDELVAIRFKSNSKTTVEMYLNNGWQLSFHS